MKVVFLARLYKPHVGGVEKHVEEISKILSKDFKITIITEQHDEKIPSYQKYSEANVYRIPLNKSSEKNKKWIIWKWVWTNRQVLYQADIIHIHDVFYWLIPLIPFLFKPRLFITFHGYEGSRPPTIKQILSHKVGEWFTWGNICIGDFHRKWYHTHPDIVSYGAVSVQHSKTHKPQDKGIFIGRLAEDTGILHYIQAAISQNLHLDIYGDGPLFNSAKKLAASSSKIRFFGFVSGASSKIPSYKYAFISRYLGILEALQAKTPIIAHYDSPIKYDYLNMAPFANWISIVGGLDSIVEAVKKIHTHPKSTHEMVEEGYNWVQQCTWSNLASDYQKLWQKRE